MAKLFGLMPDVSKLTDMFDARFRELIQHIDDGFNRVVAALQAKKDEQAGQAGIILGVIIVVLVLALIGLFSVCTPGENDHGDSLGRVELVSHRYDDRGDCDRYGDCYDDRDDGSRNGRDKRTCFFGCDNVIVIPGLPGMGGGDEQPPPRERASLVPPTPDKIIAGFQTMVDAGINLGTTITKLVTDYVVTIFRFIV